MEDIPHTIQQSKEVLLSSLLIENEELKKLHEQLNKNHRILEQKYQNDFDELNSLKQKIKSIENDKNHHVKQSMLKEKIIDIKSVELSKLNKEVEKLNLQIVNLERDFASQGDRNNAADEIRNELSDLKKDFSKKEELLTGYEEEVESLKFQNRRLQHAMKGAGQGTWEYDAKAEEFTFSKEWCEIFGFNKSELKRDLHAFFLMIHTEDKKEFKSGFENLQFRNTGEFTTDIRILNREDHYQSVTFSANFFQNPVTNSTQLVGYTLEKTEQMPAGMLTEFENNKVKLEECHILINELESQLSDLQNAHKDDESAQIAQEEVNILTSNLEAKNAEIKELSEEFEVVKEILKEKESELAAAADEVEKLKSSAADHADTEKYQEEIDALKHELTATKDEFKNLSLVASKTDNAIIITDKDGKIEYVNQGFERLTEYTFDEVKGKKPGTFLQGEETSEENVIAIREGLKSGKPFTQDILNYSKSGQSYWLSISITPIFDDNGDVQRFIAVERDITASKKRDTELEEAESELRSLMEDQFIQSEQLLIKEKELSEALEESERIREEVENLSIVASKTDNAVIITDPLGQILYVNDGFERITEYSREEVMGKKPGTFLQGPDTDIEHVRAIREGLKSKIAF